MVPSIVRHSVDMCIRPWMIVGPCHLFAHLRMEHSLVVDEAITTIEELPGKGTSS